MNNQTHPIALLGGARRQLPTLTLLQNRRYNKSSMARKLTLLDAFWAFVLSMPLCASGVVAHPCDPCQTACPHDTTCSQDPCSFKVAQGDSGATLAHLHLDLAPFLHLWLTFAQLALTPDGVTLIGASMSPRNRSAQFYPTGSFPLLV